MATPAQQSSLTNASNEMDITTFYKELSFLVLHIPKHNFLTICGNINTQIGRQGNNEHCLQNSPNKNSEYLADFSLENSLSWLNIDSKKGRENYESAPTQITLKYS